MRLSTHFTDDWDRPDYADTVAGDQPTPPSWLCPICHGSITLEGRTPWGRPGEPLRDYCSDICRDVARDLGA